MLAAAVASHTQASHAPLLLLLLLLLVEQYCRWLLKQWRHNMLL
jgi:hypothetical protein